MNLSHHYLTSSHTTGGWIPSPKVDTRPTRTPSSERCWSLLALERRGAAFPAFFWEIKCMKIYPISGQIGIAIGRCRCVEYHAEWPNSITTRITKKPSLKTPKISVFCCTLGTFYETKTYFSTWSIWKDKMDYRPKLYWCYVPASKLDTSEIEQPSLKLEISFLFFSNE